MVRWLREPLLQFALLGAALFAAAQLVGGGEESGAPEEIVVTRGRIEQLATVFVRTWQHAPTPEELTGLVEDHVREEVLYREALAMGLDRDDVIVRRRMRQKLEFLLEDDAALAQPDESELRRLIDEDPARYRGGALVAFEQAFFGPGDSGRARATESLGALPPDAPLALASGLGEPTLLPDVMPLSEIDAIGRTFGEPFARAVAQAAPLRWSGPLESAYGWHLVRVLERADPEVAEGTMRERALRDWRAARRRAALDATYDRLRAKYRIVVETPADSDAAGGAAAPAMP